MCRSELADALDHVADRAPSLTFAARALRDGECSEVLADALDDHAATLALRWGNYDGANTCRKAAEALRTAPDPADTIVTGEFRAIGSSCIGGVACVEYEADDTARYVLAGLGHPEQPPELVRVWPTDVDD